MLLLVFSSSNVHLVWADSLEELFSGRFFSAGSVINFTLQARHHRIVRKKSVLQAQKDPFYTCFKNRRSQLAFALTTNPQTDIIVFGFGGNGICRLGDVKWFLAALGEVLLEADFMGACGITLAGKHAKVSDFQKEITMKNAFVRTIVGVVGGAKRTSFLLLAVLLCILVFWLGGCSFFEQPGETAAEGHRRHLRNLSINQQNLMSDIDRALLMDKPSKLSDKRIPPDIGTPGVDD